MHYIVFNNFVSNILKKPAEAGSGNFCYEVFPTLGYFTRPMRTVSRLRLLFCLIYGHRLPSAITPTLDPIDPVSGPL